MHPGVHLGVHVRVSGKLTGRGPRKSEKVGKGTKGLGT